MHKYCTFGNGNEIDNLNAFLCGYCKQGYSNDTKTTKKMQSFNTNIMLETMYVTK